MKRLIMSIAAFLMLATITQAQRGQVLPLVAGDTIATTASIDSVYHTIQVSAGYSNMGIQVNFTKISGTITVKPYIYTSLDGTNFTLTDSATAFANQAGVQSVLFNKTPPAFSYYKVMVRNIGASTSTESGVVRIWYVLRKYSQ